jgi:hypothetical protein
MKAILLSASCMLFAILLKAQTLKPALGLNATDFSKEPNSSDVKGKIGFQVGGSIAFGKKVYFEPGIFYVGKSTEVRSSLPDDPEEFKADIKGIRVPVAVGIDLLGNKHSTVAIRAFGGASGFFITSVGDDIDENEINKTNWGVFAGAGLDVWRIFVDLSYEWSVTNIQKDVDQIDFGKSRSLFLNVGLRLPLQSK